jgi:3'-phosphoadenosine 5'-phosphosulfate sulfotransferase (PAPS reductase)/FAD synthetase
MPSILVDPTIEQQLQAGAPVGLAVSGGKDSDVLGLDGNAHLDRVGHTGPRILIHSDLGRVEWKGSKEGCERLAERLGLELVVVRRQQGDLMDRWLQRWTDNMARYANLEVVKVILPWSTPSMRFCTSELKTTIICRELVRRFPGQTIINAVGIRWDEGMERKNASISEPQEELQRVRAKTTGFNWHPLLNYTEADIYEAHARHAFPLQESYTLYGASRHSCVFCIMATLADLLAGASCEDNHDLYREMVDLEILSAFSFQSGRWLGDVRPDLLTTAQQVGLAMAKQTAFQRELVESLIPKHLLYTKGWPTVMPTVPEAKLLAKVRSTVGALMGVEMRFTTASEIRDRYQQLMAENAARIKKKAKAA